MSETQQTTGDRIMRLIESRFPDKAAQIIAAEIDALTRERDEAREIAKKYEDRFFAAASQAAGALAEVERLRPAAEAWRTLEDFREAERTGTLSDEKRTRKIHETARDAARAREAAKEGG